MVGYLNEYFPPINVTVSIGMSTHESVLTLCCPRELAVFLGTVDVMFECVCVCMCVCVVYVRACVCVCPLLYRLISRRAPDVGATVYACPARWSSCRACRVST